MKSTKVFSTITGSTQEFERDGTESAAYQSSLASLGEAGQRIEEIQFRPTGVVETKKVFDEQGSLQEEIAYNADGSLNFRYVVEYDEQGRERERIMFLADGSAHGRWLSSYDTAGMLVERAWFNQEGVREVAERFEYDEENRLRRKERGAVGEWTYSYDNAGRLSRIRGGYFSGDEPEDESYEYDGQGRVSRLIRFYSNGEVRSITNYKYSLSS